MLDRQTYSIHNLRSHKLKRVLTKLASPQYNIFESNVDHAIFVQELDCSLQCSIVVGPGPINETTIETYIASVRARPFK